MFSVTGRLGRWIFLFLPFLAFGTQPQHAIFSGYDSLAKGKCRSVTLSDEGVLAPAPAVSKWADLGVDQAWSLLPLPDGSALVGTAPEGKLLRVSADGSVKLWSKFAENFLYALAMDEEGAVYVGTSPEGKVYRVDSLGRAEVWFEPKETYIWALLAAPHGVLYVATGTHGKVYRVTGRNQGEVWYASEETHLRSLALAQDGALLAGSADSGYLYKITGRDHAVVLASTGRQEVNQIRLAADGTIYFTATGAAKPTLGKPSANLSSALANLVLHLKTGGLGGPSSPVSFADSNAAPGEGGISQLYRLDATLYPQVIASLPETILSLFWDEKKQRAILGTGHEGYVYAVNPHGDGQRLLQVDSESLTGVAAQPDGGVLLAASNPGRLYHLTGAESQPALYESDVIDSSLFARWGAVTAEASQPDQVDIFTRSGNTPQPDKTWYEWEPLSHGKAQSSPARYLQIQLRLSGGTVDRIEAVYLPRNQPPHLEEIHLLPAGIGYSAYVQPASPPSPKAIEQILREAINPAPEVEDGPQVHWEYRQAHGLRTLVWKAEDPNEDDLTYTVSWRKRGSPDWQELAQNLKDPLLSWDTSGWADGHYELQVVASDAKANAPGEGLTDTIVFRDLIITNTPPEIHLLSQAADSLEFQVRAALGPLKSVTVSPDGRDYQPVVPEDGILDSATEKFRIPRTGHLLFIRAEDGNGNVSGKQVN